MYSGADTYYQCHSCTYNQTLYALSCLLWRHIIGKKAHFITASSEQPATLQLSIVLCCTVWCSFTYAYLQMFNSFIFTPECDYKRVEHQEISTLTCKCAAQGAMDPKKQLHVSLYIHTSTPLIYCTYTHQLLQHSIVITHRQ